MKNNFDFSINFNQFLMTGGACRPGYARETERADLKSCDSHGFFDDYGVSNCMMLLTGAYRCLLLLTAACYCLLLLTAAYSCLLLHTVAYCCSLMFTAAYDCLLKFIATY